MSFLSRALLCAAALCSLHAAPIQWAENGHYYDVIAVPGGIDWTTANALAAASGGYLATVTSAEENAFIYDNVIAPAGSSLYVVTGPEERGPWIGAYRTGDGPADFAWVTGETFSYANWGADEPNNLNGTEFYVEYMRKGNGDSVPGNVWNDLYNDSGVAGYVVEFDSDPVAVPEASTSSLLLLGTAGLYMLRRRK